MAACVVRKGVLFCDCNTKLETKAFGVYSRRNVLRCLRFSSHHGASSLGGGAFWLALLLRLWHECNLLFSTDVPNSRLGTTPALACSRPDGCILALATPGRRGGHLHDHTIVIAIVIILAIVLAAAGTSGA